MSRTRRPRAGRLTAALGATALTAAALATAVPAEAAPTSSTTLVVNANQVLRPVTHVATGSLYGLADNSTPSDSLTNALKPNTFVQMAPGGSQLPNGEPKPAATHSWSPPRRLAQAPRWSSACPTGTQTSPTSG